jgi:ribose/xylose/arabinose/galactoside ABC-type transport system permease subunit
VNEIPNKPSSHRETAKNVLRAIVRHENAVLLLVLLGMIGGLAGFTHGTFVKPANAVNVILQSAERGIAAVGQTFVILTAGIDVSVGGVALMSLILGAVLMTGTTAVPVGPIAVILLFGIAVGSFNGSLVSRLGIPALIVTLGVWEASGGAAFLMSGGETIWDLPPFISYIGQGRIAGVPVPVIIFIAIAVVGYFVLQHTTYGRSIYAVGGNSVSAWLSGIRVKNILFSVYVISGFLAALAGLIIMGRCGCASTVTAGGLELDSIAATVVGGVSLMGGRGNILGVIIGTIIISVIRNGMNIIGLHPAFHAIVKGVVIIVAVVIDYIRRR